MQKSIRIAVLAAALVASGSALAESFGVNGYGRTPEEARQDAWATAIASCQNQGYGSAYVEEVQTYESGGSYITYGLADCF